MADAQQNSPTVDPDDVPETICLGMFNVSINAPLATLTFTHYRPKVGPLFEASTIDNENVVRARIVISVDSLVGLRDVLSQLIQNSATGAASAVGRSKLN
jgi:hypothetical protein